MNKVKDSHKRGIAFLIQKEDGIIRDILYNKLDLQSPVQVGQDWMSILDSECRPKAVQFFQSLQAQNAVFDWEMNCPILGEVMSIRFAGVLQGNQMLIVAAPTDIELTRLLEEFTRIGNEQTNVLRAALKENAKLKKAADKDSQLYDEISRLNNELINLRRQLTKQNIELESLNKIKNQFLGIAAHDLRNPLSNVLSLTEFLEEDLEDMEDAPIDLISRIKNLSNFMLSMVEELLDVSAIESGNIDLCYEELDYVKVIQEIIHLNQLQADKKNIQIFMKNEKQIVNLTIDRGKIEQVVNNLLTNAIKFSQPETHIEISIVDKDDVVVTSVKDQGQGIAPDELNNLFRPFQKTSTKSTGGEKSTGLGLYIVKRIVEAHAGEIWAESELGEGSTFSFHLPKGI